MNRRGADLFARRLTLDSSPFHLAAIGFITLLAQVVILREVLVASFGSELIYILGLGLLMLGTAAGAAIARWRVSSARGQLLFISFAVALPLLVVFARAQRLILRATPGAYLSFAQQLVALGVVLLPLGVLGGLLFTNTARLYVCDGRTLAGAYAIESAGGVLGGAVSTALIAAGAQNFASALLCAAAAALAALAGRGKLLKVAGAVAAALLLGAIAFSTRIDQRLTALNHPQLLASRDTPYGRTTISGSSGQVAVFQNDAFAYENQGTSAEEFVHTAALQVERPRSVLILGGAVEGIPSEVAKHRPARIIDVEADRRLVETAQPFLDGGSLGEAAFAEPRRFLDRSGHFDLILSAMPEPDSGQASRFYTREFFRTCARHLAPGGVLAFRLRSSENLWTPALAERTASIVDALRGAFSDVVVLPGSVNVVISSNEALERRSDVLSSRFIARDIQARLVSPQYLRYVYTNDRVGEIADVVRNTRVPPNTDSRPSCYRYTLLLWLSRFFPSVAAARAGIDPKITVPLLALAAVAAIAVSRRSRAIRRTLLVAFAGFAGVVFEATLILAYQISEGVLYQDLGLLLMMFMSGLAVGSWALRSGGGSEKTGVLLLCGVAALACLTAWRLSLPDHALASSALFLVASGAMTGAVFGYASVRHAGNQDEAVAPLYAADLAGGVGGSMAASLLLIPLLGLPGSVIVVGVLALLAIAWT